MKIKPARDLQHQKNDGKKLSIYFAERNFWRFAGLFILAGAIYVYFFFKKMVDYFEGTVKFS